MRVHLGRTGATPEDLEGVIATLVEQGYLDDERFARLFVQDKRALEEWGSDRIRRALVARGVDSDLIAQALTEDDAGAGTDGLGAGGDDLDAGGDGLNGGGDGLDGDGEMGRALALLRRRFPSPTGDRRERERALGVLLRKGYDADLALEAITAHTQESAPIE
jgi:regulatory protein